MTAIQEVWAYIDQRGQEGYSVRFETWCGYAYGVMIGTITIHRGPSIENADKEVVTVWMNQTTNPEDAIREALRRFQAGEYDEKVST